MTENEGLFGQFQRTRASFTRLLHAHIALVRAEIGEILAQVKTIAAMAGVALALGLLVGNMLYIGGFLFMGEWLFGSIGWGLAHGVLFGIDLMIVLVLAILGAPRGRAAAGFLISALVAIGLSVLLGLNVANDSAAYLAGQLAAPFDSVGLVAALSGALVFGVLFLLILGRLAGRGGALGGLIFGALIGLPLGWLMSGAPWTWPPAVGFSITIALLLWPLFAVALAWPKLDVGERFKRLYPQQSIDAANETKAWLEEQWQTRRPMRGKK